MGPHQVLLPLRVRVDLGVIAMKGYSTFPKALGLKPLSGIFRTLDEELLHLCSQYILHPQLTGLYLILVIIANKILNNSIWPTDGTLRGTTTQLKDKFKRLDLVSCHPMLFGRAVGLFNPVSLKKRRWKFSFYRKLSFIISNLCCFS